MNKSRRAKISEFIDNITACRDELRDLQGEEQEAFDNLPESFQESSKGEKMQNAIDGMENAIDIFDQLECALNEIIEE